MTPSSVLDKRYIDTMYNAYTTIEELHLGKVVSARTLHVLTAQRINTLGQLAEAYPVPEQMLRLKNFGRKCLYEIKTVMEETSLWQDDARRSDTPGVIGQKTADIATGERMSEEVKTRIDRALADEYEALTAGDDELSVHIRTVFPAADDLHRAVCAGAGRLLDAYNGADRRNNRELTMELRRRYRHFIENMMMRLEWQGMQTLMTYGAYASALKTMIAGMKRFSMRDIFECCLTDMQQTYVREVYARRVAQLCVRSRNFLRKNIPQPEDMMQYAGADISVFLRLVSHASKTKTLADMQRLGMQLKDDMTRIQRMTDDDIVRTRIDERHTFLDDRQKQTVFRHIRDYGFEPRFFLLYHYMRTSAERSNRIYSLSFGLIDGVRHGRQEVADMPDVKLSRERVRQICEEKNNLEVANTPYVSGRDLTRYEALTRQPFICEYTPEYEEIRRRESLDIDFSSFARLVTLMFDYDAHDIEDHTLLTAGSLSENISPHRYADKIKRLCSGRITADRHVPVEMITGDVRPHERTAADIVKYIARVVYGLEMSGDNTLLVPRNNIDVSDELYDILARHGRPMSDTELLEAFKELYPDHKYTKTEQIKHAITSNGHILPIGKSARYTLDTWTGIYRGTKRDILTEALTAAGEPLRVDELFAKVICHYPDTTMASVKSLLCNKMFIPFQDERYGLASKQYDGRFLTREQRKRISFDERMQQVGLYIQNRGRLPKSSGTKEEKALYRWIYNVRKRIVSSSPEQWEKLNSLIGNVRKGR